MTSNKMSTYAKYISQAHRRRIDQCIDECYKTRDPKDLLLPIYFTAEDINALDDKNTKIAYYKQPLGGTDLSRKEIIELPINPKIRRQMLDCGDPCASANHAIVTTFNLLGYLVDSARDKRLNPKVSFNVSAIDNHGNFAGTQAVGNINTEMFGYYRGDPYEGAKALFESAYEQVQKPRNVQMIFSVRSQPRSPG